MTSFSEKYGYKLIKSVVQIEAVDDDLRNGLWNRLDSHYWSKANPSPIFSLLAEPNKDILRLLQKIWSGYFKLPMDTIGTEWKPAYSHLRDYYFSCSWNEVYDFVEFVANHYHNDFTNDGFREECNAVLKQEVAGYRFVGNSIVPITAEEEIAEIEEALHVPRDLKPVAIHLNSALEKFSDKESPDYRNSIKESISAVEAISSQIAGKDKAELAEALKTLSEKIQLHTSLRQGFIKLYGYTSDAEGIRHALLKETVLDFEDAKFMLVACSAFVNYLKVKASKAGISLT